MFDIKCINCKFFSHLDGCEKGFDEENCNDFLETNNPLKNEDEPSCDSCKWNEDGDCIFDMENPLSCRRYKSLGEND